MPVTAKLSRHFYETLGDEIANELVEWFNQVDSTYRADLRELNELNFARFDAKLEQRVAELDARFETRLERRLAELETKLERGLAALETKLETRLAEFEAKSETRLAGVDAKIELRMNGLRAELIKWMFVFWIGTLAPLAGLVVALTR
jgi:DNA anti-recombination protein RmuC